MLRRISMAAVLVALATGAQAQSLDIELSDESARFNYGTVLWGQQYGRVEMEGGFLFNSDDNYALHAGMHVYNDTWDSPVELGIGGRLYYASIDEPDLDGGALALGLRALYRPEPLGGFGIGASYYYSPSIVSFSDVEHLNEYNVLVDYRLMPQANVYVGYRRLRLDVEDMGWRTVDKGAYVGFQIRF